MRKLLIIILIIFLPLYFLLKSVDINTFNRNFYLNFYERYNVVEVTGKRIDELDQITRNLYSYIKGESVDEVLKPFFNEREIKHLEDVKVLFMYGFSLKKLSFALSLFGIIIFFIYKDVVKFGQGIFYGAFIWWGLILLLLLSTMDFNKYFTCFHLIFFDNDLWLLDSDTDLLIQMLPEEFFISIFRRIVLLFMVILAIIQLTGYILMKKGKDKSGRVIDF